MLQKQDGSQRRVKAAKSMSMSIGTSTPQRQQLMGSASSKLGKSPEPSQEQTPTALYPHCSLLLYTPPEIPSGLEHFENMGKLKDGLVGVLMKFLAKRKDSKHQLQVAATIRPGNDEEDDTSNNKAFSTGHYASELEKLHNLMIEDFICNALEGPGKLQRRR